MTGNSVGAVGVGRRCETRRVSDRLPLVLGVSGASGARLALRALGLLAGSPDVPALHVVVTPRALLVARDEEGTKIRTARDWVAAAQGPEHLAAKAEAFGWKSVIIDGHNPSRIRDALPGSSA